MEANAMRNVTDEWIALCVGWRRGVWRCVQASVSGDEFVMNFASNVRVWSLKAIAHIFVIHYLLLKLSELYKALKNIKKIIFRTNSELKIVKLN